MKTKIIQFTPVILTILALSFSYFSEWCTRVGNLCYRTILDQMIPEFTYPLYFFALYLLPLAIVLVLVPRAVFNSWLKLAAWMLPLAFIYIAMTPISFSGIGLNFFPFYRDDAARLASEVFTIVSLLLIVWKYFASRRA